MSVLLETKSLYKTYQANGVEVPVLQGIDISITAGEFVAVMGPSGSGKSTLLHLMGGLDQPTSGQIFLEGARIDALNEGQRAILRRSQIGIVFQFFNLVSNLTVAENIDLPALMSGLSAGEARQRRKSLVETLGIVDKVDRVPNRLSGGEQQRVALARALINRPSLLLADEPTGNLNSRQERDVLKLLQEYHASGQTLLLVTHSARVASIADRVLYLRDGQIKDETHLEKSEDSSAVLSRLIEFGA
jgi:putative ABC transport system ATP-binding protein